MTTERQAVLGSESGDSLYQRVIEDSESRDAYFNTTRAQLFGDRDSDEVKGLMELLDENAVAFLFSSDTNLARPLLQVASRQFVGENEIRQAIKHFLIRASQDSSA